MRRQWRYLIFPSSSGTMTIPSLEMTVFDPARDARQELGCSGSYFNAQVAAPAPGAAEDDEPVPPPSNRLPLLIGLAIAIAAALLGWPLARREISLRRAVREVMRGGTSEVMPRVRARITFDEREASERGEALRALRSIVDAVDQGRDVGPAPDREIARRVKDVLRG